MSASRLAGLALSGALIGTLDACGARTGLGVPDVYDVPDVDDVNIDASDATDVADVAACREGRFVLTARAADLIFVIDRSTSMNQSLGSLSRWRALRNALASSLPRFEASTNVGALFYPEASSVSREASCQVVNIPQLDLAPSTGNAGRVLEVFSTTAPNGSTPTAAALLRAYNWVVRNPSRARARFLVLATDGAPACNAALNPATCACVTGGGGGGGGRCSDALRCLDDTRSIETVRQIASNPLTAVPVYVVGLAGDNSPAYTATLRAMAVAGGRPNRAGGAPSFYDAREPETLGAALSAIQNEIARCTFVTPSRPTVTDGLRLSLNGRDVAYDPTRVNGWDWTDRAFGELTLFGAACPSDASPDTQLVATVACE